MPDAIQCTSTPLTDLDRIGAVCKRIPPLWDLPNYVAVNPFMGFAGESIPAAARQVADALDARVLPDTSWYRKRWREGAFGRADVEKAARRLGHDPARLLAILDGRLPMPLRTRATVWTFAERYDRRHGTSWNDTLQRNLTRWCAVEISGAGAHWNFDTDGVVRYATWRETAAADRSLEIAGLKGWRTWIRQLPTAPETVVTQLLDRLDVPEAKREAYLYRLLGGIFGFACYLRRSPWQNGGADPGPLLDLLAIRVASDAAVAMLLPEGRIADDGTGSDDVEDEDIRFAFQEALEEGYAGTLIGRLNPPPKPGDRPAVQAVFCIDVRSEPFRRHLETLDERVQTIGFAGFFGVFLDWQVDGTGSARCPVLFEPSAAIRKTQAIPPGLVKHSLKHAQYAPSASFSFVELLGLGYGVGMAADALVKRPTWHPTEGTDPFRLDPGPDGAGVAAAARVDIAAGMLKHMGMKETFARIVMLCGHEGRSANNPHQAGLDCGACGGHGGAINARVAAAILNDALVRQGLVGRGWVIPEDTWFVPAVHDTSVDEVTLFDTERLPASHVPDLYRLEAWLAAAGAGVRAERAPDLGLAMQPALTLLSLLHRRAEDWSEVRPEWALARNAAFIAARRGRTRGLDLAGRSFLHEYDCETDPEDNTLTLILIAPMVVASWINLQYFASTVDNDVFGCGNKTLHNRLGPLGVVIGNGGDLRTGLARQSVCNPDGSWFHEPMRLQVIVEATRERIDAVLDAHSSVRDLVENGWVRLFALNPTGNEIWRRLRGGLWEPAGATAEVAAAEAA